MNTIPRTNDEYLALRFALPPLLAWTISLFIFNALAFDLSAVTTELTDALAVRRDTASIPRAEEASLRLLWVGSYLLFLFAAIAVLAYAVWMIRSQLSRGGIRVYAVIAVVLATASLAHAATSSATRDAFSMIYFFTYDSLQACGCYSVTELGAIDIAVTVLNVIAAVVPPVALIAGCSVLVLPREEGANALAEIERRVSQLKTVLTGGSALLVTGLIHQTLWQRWPATLAGGEAGLLRFVDSMSIYWGITYSLLIVAFYVPPIWIMNRRARAIMDHDPALAGEAGADAWLAKRGLSRTALNHLPQVTAILAPLLVGSFGSSLAELGNVLPG